MVISTLHVRAYIEMANITCSFISELFKILDLYFKLFLKLRNKWNSYVTCSSNQSNHLIYSPHNTAKFLSQLSRNKNKF